MNILITMDSNGILKNIEPKDIKDFIKNEWTEEEKELLLETEEFNSTELWEKLELQLENEGKEIEKFLTDNLSPHTILKAMDESDLVDYVDNHTEYYISDDIPELMEQIHKSGNMDEVVDMFTIKY
ncbi:hypothetical protein NRK67_01700 [Fusobacteria bacterium ZRK30]|nr:hypothetical protein NRK67_01700 [Fusobacteria bacterium ZRK30]